jgi:hypothetical protein
MHLRYRPFRITSVNVHMTRAIATTARTRSYHVASKPGGSRTPEIWLSRCASVAGGSSRLTDWPMLVGSSLVGVSGQRMKPRIRLLQQPLGLHDPRSSFVLTTEARYRPELATCRCHLDVDGAIALRR